MEIIRLNNGEVYAIEWANAARDALSIALYAGEAGADDPAPRIASVGGAARVFDDPTKTSVITEDTGANEGNLTVYEGYTCLSGVREDNWNDDLIVVTLKRGG